MERTYFEPINLSYICNNTELFTAKYQLYLLHTTSKTFCCKKIHRRSTLLRSSEIKIRKEEKYYQKIDSSVQLLNL